MKPIDRILVSYWTTYNDSTLFMQTSRPSNIKRTSTILHLLRRAADDERTIVQLRYKKLTSEQEEISSGDEQLATSQEAQRYDEIARLNTNPYLDTECSESENSHYGFTSSEESDASGDSFDGTETSPTQSPVASHPPAPRVKNTYRIREDSEEAETSLSGVPSDFSLSATDTVAINENKPTVLQLLLRHKERYEQELTRTIAAINEACNLSECIIID